MFNLRGLYTMIRALDRLPIAEHIFIIKQPSVHANSMDKGQMVAAVLNTACIRHTNAQNWSWLAALIGHTSNILYRYVPLVQKNALIRGALDTSDEPCWTQTFGCSLINATWAHMLAMEMYTPAHISLNCANHCVMVVYARRRKASGTVTTNRIPQQVVKQKSWTVSFQTYSSLCPHVCLAQQETRF